MDECLVRLHGLDELAGRWVDPDLARRVAPYRGGYLPEERRDITAIVEEKAVLLGGIGVACDIGDEESVEAALDGRHGRAPTPN